MSKEERKKREGEGKNREEKKWKENVKVKLGGQNGGEKMRAGGMRGEIGKKKWEKTQKNKEKTLGEISRGQKLKNGKKCRGKKMGSGVGKPEGRTGGK